MQNASPPAPPVPSSSTRLPLRTAACANKQLRETAPARPAQHMLGLWQEGRQKTAISHAWAHMPSPTTLKKKGPRWYLPPLPLRALALACRHATTTALYWRMPSAWVNLLLCAAPSPLARRSPHTPLPLLHTTKATCCGHAPMPWRGAHLLPHY